MLMHAPLSESLWPSFLIDFSSIVQEQVRKSQHEIGNFMKNARLHEIYVTVGGELPELLKPVSICVTMALFRMAL